MQCPTCNNDNAISLSCLDLSYSVTLYKERKDLKDEKSDKTAPFLLHNLEEDDTIQLVNLSLSLSLSLSSLPLHVTSNQRNNLLLVIIINAAPRDKGKRKNTGEMSITHTEE